MPEDPRATSSLFRLAQDVGSIKQGVKQLEDGQREVDRKITGLQRSVAGLVTREDCKASRQDLTARIAVERPRRPPSSERPAWLETAGKKAGAASAILGLLAMLVVGLVLVSRFVSSVERAIEADRKEQLRQTTQVLDEIRSSQRPPIIIQQPAQPPPDAGPARKRRRRTR